MSTLCLIYISLFRFAHDKLLKLHSIAQQLLFNSLHKFKLLGNNTPFELERLVRVCMYFKVLVSPEKDKACGKMYTKGPK